MASYVDQSSSDKQVKLIFSTYLLTTMVFQKAISHLRNLASRKAKNASKKGDISTETQTARGEHEEIQFTVDAERATEQQANSSKQRRSKKNILFQNKRRK